MLHRLISRTPSVNLTKRFLSSKFLQFDDVIIDSLKGEDNGIIILSLNRPKEKNSLSKSLSEHLSNALTTVKYDNNARVLIIKSNVPGVFCAGADLKERLALSEIEVKMAVSGLRNLMSQIENLPIPVIAAIDGVALGGGLEMALASDIRIASFSAKVGLVETKLAIIPGAGGTQRLPRIIGTALAKELIFTGRILNGLEAFNIGLVNHCVEPTENKDSAYLKALSIAREIIPNGPVGVRMAKQAINKGTEIDINSGFAVEELCYAQVVPTVDRIEGLKAFSEKRKPVYLGK